MKKCDNLQNENAVVFTKDERFRIVIFQRDCGGEDVEEKKVAQVAESTYQGGGCAGLFQFLLLRNFNHGSISVAKVLAQVCERLFGSHK